MEDKRLKDAFSNTSVRELQFTKEDRHKVFDQIRKIEAFPYTQKKSLVSVKKLAPVTVSLLVVGLCLFLFMPSILPGDFTKNSSSSDVNQESNPSVVNDLAVEEAEFFTTLITVKSKEMDNRVYVNLLLTYNKHKKIMKVVSLPASTYVPVADNSDGTTVNDNLLFAYHFGGAENVKTAVSKLLDVPIDYYAVIDLETISTLIDSLNGIEYELQEDVQIRAITQVAFEFEKGTYHFNGEEVVALLMAATEGNSLDEEDLVNLMQAVMSKTEAEMPQIQLKELFTQTEANTSLDPVLDNQIKINVIQSVSLRDGMIADHIPINSSTGQFIYRFEKDFLDSVKKELTTFNKSNKSLKEEYLIKVDNAKAEAEKLEATDSSTYAMKKVENDRWELWDNLLNEIYVVLKEQLSAEEMDQLREEQRNWIKYRDDSALKASLKYKGGTQEHLEYVAVLASLTEKRCYELIETYMK